MVCCILENSQNGHQFDQSVRRTVTNGYSASSTGHKKRRSTESQKLVQLSSDYKEDKEEYVSSDEVCISHLLLSIIILLYMYITIYICLYRKCMVSVHIVDAVDFYERLLFFQEVKSKLK